MDLLKKVLKMKVNTKTEGKQICERTKHGDDLVPHGLLLNRRQCVDLMTKLSDMDVNIHLLAEGIKSRDEHLELALQELVFYRCFEKAKMLVANCGQREWWQAAVFQWQNENAFREILLELSLCYHLIHVKVTYHRGILPRVNETLPNDLWQSTKFEPASVEDVRKDEEELSSLLKKLVSDHESIESEYRPTSKELPLAQSLARYLLLRMQWASEQSLASQTEKCKALMWGIDGEQLGTWGTDSFIPEARSLHVSGWRVKWLGIHCFKKEFHGKGEGFERSILREAAIMAHLKHPNIIQFVCWGEDREGRKSRFIGMELMEKNLFKLIEDQKGVHFSLEVILDIMWQIARGMCYLHDQGIAHRDLKPQNVMVNELTSIHGKGYWQVKLIDYGCSKTEVEIEQSNSISQFGIGTGVYRAPEVLKLKGWKSRGRAMWMKADVFSFAMTCVHVLTLHQPFKDIREYGLDDLYDKVMNGARPSLPTNCPEDLSALLRKCWNIIPSKRPTFVNICLELEALKQGMRLSTFERRISLFGFDFISERIESESSHFQSLPKVIFAEVIEEDENKPSDVVSIISCICNGKLDLLEKSPYGGLASCNMCGKVIFGEVYNCSTCQFDAHPHCAEIREKVHVFYHGHSLQLLTQNYYKNNPKAKCSFCEESTQNSDWVYRCEGCDYDVHARCTKFQNNHRSPIHHHPLNMITCPPWKSLSCKRCNGAIEERTWHYYCGPCAFSVHSYCVTLPINPLCLFNKRHRLDYERISKIFDCALCDKQGYSQFYNCEFCNVDVHPNCVDSMSKRTCIWSEAYEKVMMVKENNDVHALIIMISEILDKMSSYNDSQGDISTPAVRKVHPPIHELKTSNESHESLDFANEKLRREMISTQTTNQMKAKKLVLNTLKEDPLEMLVNLEKIVLNLQNIENASEDEEKDLLAVHKRLKQEQQLVKEEKAIQEESKLCPGPRIGVFFKRVEKDGEWLNQLLIDLQAGMKDVYFDLLCEKPGHEHIVPGKTKVFRRELDEEFAENLKPLVACGLLIVRNNIASIKDDLGVLRSISIPNLEASEVWDLSAINKLKSMENMEVLKQDAASSSEWFLKRHEIYGNFKEAYGLHRIRYKLTDEENPPCYKNGSLAWLCKDHFDDGLKEGILESYSSKYHNIEDDYEIRYPQYLREM